MKKFLCLVISMSLIFGMLTVSYAKTGDVLGYAKYTDISAYINHYPITSYNINDYTAVVAEDLRNYGFDVVWDGDARSLSITKNTGATQMMSDETIYKYSSMKGQNSFPYLETDIVTYVNGSVVKSFNINGKTCVYMDDLMPYGEVVWVPEVRAIKMWVEGMPVKEYAPIQEAPMTKLYAADGRSIYVMDSEVESYKAVGWFTEPVASLSAVKGVYKHSQYSCSVTISEYDGTNIVFEIISIGQNGNRIAVAVVRDTISQGICHFDFTDTFGNSGNGVLMISDSGKLSLNFYNVTGGGLWSVTMGAGEYHRTGDVPKGYEPLF